MSAAARSAAVAISSMSARSGASGSSSSSDEVGVVHDDREDVVEVVGDAAREPPDGLHLLRMAELDLALPQGLLGLSPPGLRALALRDVAEVADDRADVRVIQPVGPRRLDPAHGTVGPLHAKLLLVRLDLRLAHLGHALPHGVAIVRVHVIEKPGAQEGVRDHAQNRRRGRARVEDAPVLRVQRDRLGAPLDNRAEARLEPPLRLPRLRLPELALDGRREPREPVLQHVIVRSGAHGLDREILSDRTGHDEKGDVEPEAPARS